jgi:hypothetical protein
MRVLSLAALCLPSLALADIASPAQSACDGKEAGAPCSVGGLSGTCQEVLVTRPDYSEGPPPTYTQVKVLQCVGTSAGQTRAREAALGGLALAAVALVAARATRRRRPEAVGPA